MSVADYVIGRWVFLAGLVSAGWASLAWSQTGTALPQPDVVFYGRVTLAPAGTEVVPTTVAWTMTGNNESVTSAQTQIVTIDDVTYYITRLPFEVRQLGDGTALTPSVDTLELTRPDTVYTRTATVGGKAAILPAGRGSLTYGVDTLGLIERMDLVVGETYAEWAARLLGDSNADPNDDPDGDGLSNEKEYHAGTDPTSGSSALKGSFVPQLNGNVLVKWPSVEGKRYRVERATDLTVVDPWAILVDDVLGTGEELEFLDSGAHEHDRLFYRVSVDVP